jgi:hypothetical protein
MIYLAVYGDEFLKKVQEVWGNEALVGEGKTGLTGRDVESSRPLITPQQNETAVEPSTSSEQNLSKRISWYLFLMPIWCDVARMGKSKLAEFREKEALKSPHINRLGKCEPPSFPMMPVNVPRVTSADTGKASISKFLAPKHGQNPKYGATVGGNQAIGAAILAQQRATRSAARQNKVESTADVDEPPTWYDFCVAIFFVGFGMMALCAGLFSILTAK